MSVKLVLLKSGENVIADVKELVSDEKVHAYLLVNPQKVVVDQPFLFEETDAERVRRDVKVSISPWIFLTSDSEIIVRPDWVVTLVEPIDSVTKMYNEKIAASKNDQSNSINQ